MRTIGAEELKAHGGDASEKWIVLHGNVYNVTEFMSHHPGGAEILKKKAGTDATKAFEEIHHHSNHAAEVKKGLMIGIYEDK
jgi:cytochrome b involved in lipid metabolism